MKLELKRTRTSILPLCLLSMMLGTACGGDDAADPDSTPRTDASTSSATANQGDAGKPTPGTGMSTQDDTPIVKKDAGTPVIDDGDDELVTDPGNTLFKGPPSCKDFVSKVAGSIAGKPVAWTFGGSYDFDDVSLGIGSGGTDRGWLNVYWTGALKLGTNGELTRGDLKLPPQYMGEYYCVLEGKVQADPILGLELGEERRFFVHITKLQPMDTSYNCVGEPLEADVKICTH